MDVISSRASAAAARSNGCMLLHGNLMGAERLSRRPKERIPKKKEQPFSLFSKLDPALARSCSSRLEVPELTRKYQNYLRQELA